jgi:hypothetical protein
MEPHVLDMNVPLPAMPAAPGKKTRNRDDARDRDVARLLHSWRSLAASLLMAEAHEQPGVEELLDQLNAVEDALSERHPQAFVQLDAEMRSAQLRFDHHEPQMPVAHCLVCRRVSAGLPLDLPLPRTGERR